MYCTYTWSIQAILTYKVYQLYDSYESPVSPWHNYGAVHVLATI